MANSNSQFHSSQNSPPRQDGGQMYFSTNNLGYVGGGHTQGAIGRHNTSQGYGTNEHATHTHNAGWNTHPFATHSRSASERPQAHLVVPELSYGRRSSVPNIQHAPHLYSAPGYHTPSPGLQGHPSMADNQYQTMILSQSVSPIHPSMIPRTFGGPIPSPHSASPPHNIRCIPQSSPRPPSQLGYGYPSGTPFSLHCDQGDLAGSNTSYTGDGRGTSGLNSRAYHLDARQTSSTWGQMQGAHSPVDLSPVASSSRILFEGSDSATSPGADSDAYHSFPNTPADTSGAMFEDFGEAAQRDKLKKEKQKVKKQGDRGRESVNFKKVKDLLKLGSKTTKADTLEQVITFLGGDVPARTSEPTQALPGRDRRSERARQVSGSRNDITRLFDAIGKCMGYTDRSPPKREQLLEEVAKKIEELIVARTQYPGPQGGGGPGGSHWMAQ